jgi:hypothetical protein
MIPVYNGAVNEPFDSSKIAIFLIQIENQNRKSDFSVGKYMANYEELFGNSLVLSILVDLNMAKAKCVIQPTYKTAN